MSRVAKMPVPLPKGVEVTQAAGVVRIKGPKGDLSLSLASQIEVHHASLTDFLAEQPPNSMHRYVLLDAQDWMNDAELTALWTEITRTARPEARVIFRTAAADDARDHRDLVDDLQQHRPAREHRAQLRKRRGGHFGLDEKDDGVERRALKRARIIGCLDARRSLIFSDEA